MKYVICLITMFVIGCASVDKKPVEEKKEDTVKIPEVFLEPVPEEDLD